jgi:hypothetical protein
MTPVSLHGRLDERGLLDDAHNSGTYALEVAVPDSVERVHRRYLDAKGHPLDDGMGLELAAAAEVVYVGRSGDVYGRLMDHVRGEVRRASFLEAFDVTDVRGVWGDDENSNLAERRRARSVSGPATAVWSDGVVF